MDFKDFFKNYTEEKVELTVDLEFAGKYILDKFKNINFVEEGHKYTVNDEVYTSVSNIIKMYEIPFDQDTVATNYANKYGRKKEDVLIEWKLNNLKSTISGTRTHEFGESYTNLLCGHPEKICQVNRPQYVKEFNVLIPTYAKEESVKKFYDEKSINLYPVGAELMLSTEYIKGAKPICGTCDILFYDAVNKGYVIGDWKTNKSLIKDYNRNNGICMTYPFNNLIDEPLSHYTLQFNIYQRMLESIGLKIIGRILVWLKDDGYETFDIPHLSDESINKAIMKQEKDE